MPIPRYNINALPAMLGCLLCLHTPPARAQQAAQPTSAPHHARRHRAHHHADNLPAPQPHQDVAVSPALPGSPAPVPDEATLPPTHESSPSTNVSPAIMGLHYPEVGNGYVPGSSPQAMDDKNAASAGGVQVTVPLRPDSPDKLPPPTSPSAPP
jgi:hypothetical protein